MTKMELWAAENELDRGAAQDTHLCLQPALELHLLEQKKKWLYFFAMRAALGLLLKQNLGCDTVLFCHNLDII